MKIVFRSLLLSIALCAGFFACKKDDGLGPRPTVTMKTGGSYISMGDTVSSGDTILLGIDASANGSRDKLGQIIIRRVMPAADTETIKTIKLSGDQNDFTMDLPLLVKTTGKQTYFFIAVNTHGLDGETAVSFTVKE